MEHQQPKGRIPDVARIAVLRANALGDFILTLPALEALRAAYPLAEIVLLGTALHAQLLEDRPSPVDRVVVVPAYGGVSEPVGAAEDTIEIERFFGAMCAEGFDLAIQIHGGGAYSNRFVRRLGARVTVGLQAEDAEPLDHSIPYIYFQPEIARYLEVMSLVGAPPVTLEPHVSVTAADLAEAKRVVPGANTPLAVLHPGATDPRRRWPPQRFAVVGDALVERGLTVAVTGTEEERAAVEGVVGAMRAEALNLCDRLSLGGLAGLLARCRVMVTNDTGPMHLGNAVGARTVGIYWCFNLINAAPLYRERHRPVVSWQLRCPVCGVDSSQDTCVHEESFVEDVSPDEVLALTLDLIR